jgi:inner membrane protease subunit 1
MLPTLSYEGDCVLCSPIPYWLPYAKHRPKRGDLVVADSPNSLGNTVLKRVIGVEGDTIEIEPRRGVDRKWIAEADQSYFGERPMHPGLEGRGKDSEGRPVAHGRRGEGKYIKVPKGYVWIVGDNLSNSTDSRHYGPVPLAMVKGKVLARVSNLLPVSSVYIAYISGMAKSHQLHDSDPGDQHHSANTGRQVDCSPVLKTVYLRSLLPSLSC